jgi:hypothetical protein
MLVWILTLITAGASVDLGVYATSTECVEQMAVMQPAHDSSLSCRASSTITHS